MSSHPPHPPPPPPTQEATEKMSSSHFWVIRLQKICFSIQMIVELLFFLFFFFSFQITQNWFGSMTSTLACMKNKEWRLCLIWNQKRGISTFSVFSIFIKTVFFPFSWMMYTFNIPGENCQWYASHNKRKSKEVQLQGTGNFIIFSTKCPKENLILKITSTI